MIFACEWNKLFRTERSERENVQHLLFFVTEWILKRGSAFSRLNWLSEEALVLLPETEFACTFYVTSFILYQRCFHSTKKVILDAYLIMEFLSICFEVFSSTPLWKSDKLLTALSGTAVVDTHKNINFPRRSQVLRPTFFFRSDFIENVVWFTNWRVQPNSLFLECSYPWFRHNLCLRDDFNLLLSFFQTV